MEKLVVYAVLCTIPYECSDELEAIFTTEEAARAYLLKSLFATHIVQVTVDEPDKDWEEL